MTWRKRIFDLFFASMLVVILGPVILWLVWYIWRKQGRPLFYVAERMKTAEQPFDLGHPFSKQNLRLLVVTVRTNLKRRAS